MKSILEYILESYFKANQVKPQKFDLSKINNTSVNVSEFAKILIDGIDNLDISEEGKKVLTILVDGISKSDVSSKQIHDVIVANKFIRSSEPLHFTIDVSKYGDLFNDSEINNTLSSACASFGEFIDCLILLKVSEQSNSVEFPEGENKQLYDFYFNGVSISSKSVNKSNYSNPSIYTICHQMFDNTKFNINTIFNRSYNSDKPELDLFFRDVLKIMSTQKRNVKDVFNVVFELSWFLWTHIMENPIYKEVGQKYYEEFNDIFKKLTSSKIQSAKDILNYFTDKTIFNSYIEDNDIHLKDGLYAKNEANEFMKALLKNCINCLNECFVFKNDKLTPTIIKYIDGYQADLKIKLNKGNSLDVLFVLHNSVKVKYMFASKGIGGDNWSKHGTIGFKIRNND